MTEAFKTQPLFKRERLTDAEEVFAASQWKLMWVKFKEHKLAMVGLGILGVLYTIALFAPILAPYDPWQNTPQVYAAPSQIHFFYQGKLVGPFLYGSKMVVDAQTYSRTYTVDESKIYPIQFFVHGFEYKWLGLFNMDLHLFGVSPEVQINLIGTDKLGRDCFSRDIWGSQISLTIGLVGVFITFFMACYIGGISGYYGGVIDTVIQRFMEFVTCIPTLPMWMALAAAIPGSWGNLQIYFTITIILALRSWTGMSRQVRSKLLQLREEDFTIAAKVAGTSDWGIISTHLLPGYISYLIVSLTLAIPGMILGETTLSFLGLGLRPPTVSWGVLLQDAQNLSAIAIQSWLLLPAVLVILAIMAFNFVGDGLRDAADPYKD
jgi:peptide/nickel transport system permease protein